MNDPNENPRRYRWPWFVLAAVVLAIVLAVGWVWVAVQKVEQQRDFSAPLPSSAPARWRAEVNALREFSPGPTHPVYYPVAPASGRSLRASRPQLRRPANDPFFKRPSRWPATPQSGATPD